MKYLILNFPNKIFFSDCPKRPLQNELLTIAIKEPRKEREN